MWHAFNSDRSRFKRLCVSVYASARVCVYMCACGEMAHLVFREPHSSHLIELGEAVGEILQPGMSKVDKSRLVHRNNIKKSIKCLQTPKPKQASIIMWAKNSTTDVGHKGGFMYIIPAGGGVGDSTDLLSLRLTTRRRCMLPISSGRHSSLLECRKSTVIFFQLPIWRRDV